MSESREDWARRLHCAHTDFEDLAWSQECEIRELRAELAAAKAEVAEKTRHHEFALSALSHNIERVKSLEGQVRSLGDDKDSAEVERDIAKQQLAAAKEQVARLTAEGNARAVEELTSLGSAMNDIAYDYVGDHRGLRIPRGEVRDLIRKRIAELSAAQQPEPEAKVAPVPAPDCPQCGGGGFISTASGVPGNIGYAQHTCTMCNGTGKQVDLRSGLTAEPAAPPASEPDWIETLLAKAAGADIYEIRLIVEALCNLGREVRRLANKEAT